MVLALSLGSGNEGRLTPALFNTDLMTRKPVEPVSTRTLLMVAHLLLLGSHTVTLVYGMLNVDCTPLGPLPTVSATTFEPPPEKLCAPPVELLLPLVVELPPPPQAASSVTPSSAIRRWAGLMRTP